MSRRSRRTATAALVTIALAEDLEHARDCQRMLNSYEVDCIVKPREMGDDGQGVPIMVPEDQADSARALLEYRNAPGDFFDFGFDDAYTEDE